MSQRFAAALRLAAAGAAFAALSSCATLTKDECVSVNWAELGRADGAAGQPSSHIGRHRAACSEHNLPVNEPQWSLGWQQGIRLYCTPDNGLAQGREGRHYANSCPPDLKAGFEAAYHVARAVYDARLARDRLAVELETLRVERREARPEDRRRLDADIERKRFEVGRAEQRVRDAERDYDRYLFSRR